MSAKPELHAIPTTERAEYLETVERGIADGDAGRTIPYELVRTWLLSWGTNKELPPPECP